MANIIKAATLHSKVDTPHNRVKTSMTIHSTSKAHPGSISRINTKPRGMVLTTDNMTNNNNSKTMVRSKAATAVRTAATATNPTTHRLNTANNNSNHMASNNKAMAKAK